MRYAKILTLTLAAALLALSCGQAKKAPLAAKAEAAPAPAPVVREAEVKFLSGDVRLQAGGVWKAVEIGDTLGVASVLKTGPDSTCELAFGSVATARIGPSSTIELRAIALEAGARKVELGLNQGSVASKVDKLLGKDRYQVRSHDAVCGVRGTEFLVRATEGKPTAIAVQTGAVALLPASYDSAKLDALSETPDGEAAVQAVMDAIVATAPRVEASEETTVSAPAMAEADKAMGQVMVSLAQAYPEPAAAGAPASPAPAAAAAAPAPAELPAAVTAALSRYEGKAATVIQKPKAISEGSKKALQNLTSPVGSLGEPSPAAVAAAPAPVAEPPKPEAPVAQAAKATVPETPAPLAIKVSSLGLVAGIVPGANRVYLADAKGKLYAYSPTGKLLWSASTGTGSNENSRPVVSGSTVYFAGDASLTAFSAAEGEKLFSVPLETSNSGFFGRRPLVLGGVLYLSSDKGLDKFDPKSGAKLGQIELPEGSDMTASAYGSLICIVTRSGILCLVDPASDQIVAQVPTKAAQPVASAPVIQGDVAYFGDRKGLAVAVDLKARTTRWQRKLEASKSTGIYQDPLVTEAGVYLFSKGAIYALKTATGDNLFEPLRAVSAPPVLSGNRLWYPTDKGEVVQASPGSGSREASLKVQAAIVGQGAWLGEAFFLPAAEGGLVIAGGANFVK